MRTRFQGERNVPLLVRVWAKVGIVNECWPWNGSTGQLGHAQFNTGGKTEGAYKLLYESIFGKVKVGTQFHHRCENKRCVNPFHVEALTSRAEHRVKHRKTHCIHGHRLIEPNVYSWRSERHCQLCRCKSEARRKYIMDALLAKEKAHKQAQ